MNERTVKKVVFAKSEYLISISYVEGAYSKVLESNELYNDSFAKTLKSFSENLSKELKLDDSCILRVKGIVFPIKKKKVPRINLVAFFNNVQLVNMSLSLTDETSKTAQLCDEIRTFCAEYIDGVRAEG